eukprot:1561339-Rhodomonas_salina.1
MMTPEMYSEAATRKPAVYCSAGTVSLYHAQTKVHAKRNQEANCAMAQAREVALFMLVKILQEYPGRANTALEQTWKRHMEPVNSAVGPFKRPLTPCTDKTCIIWPGGAQIRRQRVHGCSGGAALP